MRIYVLVDNSAGRSVAAEHGLSYLVENNGVRVLFDTGQTGLFLRNAKEMGVDPGSADYTVLSHGHYDHGGGLGHLGGGILVCHPGCFEQRYSGTDKRSIGLTEGREWYENKFTLITSRSPYQLGANIFFSGEIPRLTAFESRSTQFVFSDGSPDFVADDSALFIKLEDGLFIITGCGHAGIVNTMEHAKKVTGENRVAGIMGGFHLKRVDRQTKETIRYLTGHGVKYVLPSHCTGLPVLTAFYRNFGIRQVCAGDVFEF